MFQYGRADQTKFRGDSEAAAKQRNRLLGSVRGRIAHWCEMARIHSELGSLSARELAELGLVPGDILSVARGEYVRGR
jgi:uncharacterized protein YjiS (DUF1127 family)